MPRNRTRPTADRVREALFSVLDARLEWADMAVLDLYAGSGALGMEALSRGAVSALFVESDRRAAEVISANIAALALTGATVRRGAVAGVLAGGTDTAVNLVFADPPYGVAGCQVIALPGLLTVHRWVTPGAVVVIERPASGAEIDWPGGWRVWPSRRYGDTRLEIAELA